MGKPITIRFDQGIQYPPKLGTLILKKTSNGKLAYAQNLNSASDEYGIGAATPGPFLRTLANQNKLTGVPWLRKYFRAFPVTDGFLYYVQGLRGNKQATLNRVKQVVSGQTPEIDTAIAGGLGADISTFFSPHNGHTNVRIVEMEFRPDSNGNYYLYISLTDDTDCWIVKMDIGSGGLSTSIVATNGNFTGGFTAMFPVLGADNNIYWIGKNRVSVIDTSDVYTVFGLQNGLPLGTYASCGIDWNNQLVVAYSSEAFGDFSARLTGGSSGIILWDYVNANYNKKVPAPCRYISALVTDPNGNLLCFGGRDEGKSSIYEFTGYGFNLLYTYIGDLPRNRHAIEFDSEGRIVWQTADGQICRYDRNRQVFDHLGTMPTDQSTGGLLAKGIGFPAGNEFFAGSGDTNGYYLSAVDFANFNGDESGQGASASMGVAGIIDVPDDTTIASINWHLNRPLREGEKIVGLIYENGNDTPTESVVMDFAVDGAITSKKTTDPIPEINNFALGFVWKMPDGNPTAPPITSADVETA